MFDRRTLFAIGWSCLLCLATVSPASADQTRGIHSLPGQHSLDSTDFVKTDYRYHPDYRPRPDLHQPKHAHRTPPRHWDGYRPPAIIATTAMNGCGNGMTTISSTVCCWVDFSAISSVKRTE